MVKKFIAISENHHAEDCLLNPVLTTIQHDAVTQYHLPNHQYPEGRASNFPRRDWQHLARKSNHKEVPKSGEKSLRRPLTPTWLDLINSLLK